MDKKAQAALEYLLLIAGAVLVAVIVIIVLIGAITKPDDANKVYKEKFNELFHVSV